MTVTFASPGTVRGLHWTASCDHSVTLSQWPFWSNELKQMGIGWVKLLDNGNGSSEQLVRALKSIDVIPVVRLYRPRPNPGHLQALATSVPSAPTPITAQNLNTVSRLVIAGAQYFETTNEPNLRDEWEYGGWMSLNWQQRVHAVMENWLIDAQNVMLRGGLPGFPALAPSAHTLNDSAIGSIRFYIEAVKYLAEAHPNQAMDAFHNGAWLAVHNYGWNHPPSYPYDPINQKDHPGETTRNDDCCIRAYEVIRDLVKETFGATPPIICTEGGYVPPPNGWQQLDSRYDPLTYDSQARLTVAMFTWLRENAPEVWGCCPWLVANERLGHTDPAWTGQVWYPQSGELPVVKAMKEAVVTQPPEFVPLAAIREAAWNAAGVPFNPDAAFPRFAKSHSLGVPMTAEFDVNGYRAQGYAGGIVYCKIPNWSEVKWSEW